MAAEQPRATEREEIVFIVAVTVSAESREDAWAVVSQLKEHDRVVSILPVKLKAVAT